MTITTDAFDASTELLGPDEFLIRRRLRHGLVGVDRSGNASAVFPCGDSPQASGRTSGQIRTTVEPCVELRDDDRLERHAAVCLRCLERALVPTFCTLVGAIDRELPTTGPISSAAVLMVVREWERLFRSRQRLSGDEELGLWGEAWFLTQATNIDNAVAAWRGPDAMYLDFVSPRFAIEVKTSLRGHRHRTTVEQIKAGDRYGRAFLLSIWVAEAMEGQTLAELVSQIRARVTAGNDFERRLALTGYSDSDAHLYERRCVAIGEPLMIPWLQLPRVIAHDPGATNISYTIEVEDCESLIATERPCF